jgi:glycosyltransferase involved in cell wall biosynthesis
MVRSHWYSRVTLPSTALIIRCFNEEEHIGRLLTGAMRQTRPPDEIIVVDSGSTDATLAIAAAFDVTILEISPDEFSFGRALNLGLAAADGHEICVFASAHVYPVYDTWLDHLVTAFDRPGVALAYGRQQTPAHGRYSESRLLGHWFPPTSSPRQNHPFCNNANAAVRRDVWEELPYDEELTGLEDLDWAKRAMARGMSVSYVAEAPVVHIHNESFAQIVNRYRREAVAHKQIYADQRMGMPEAIRLATINVLGDARSALSEGALPRHAVDILRFRTAQFYGTQRGFSQAGPVPEALRRRFYYPAATANPAPAPGVPGRLIEYDRSAAR